MITLFEFLVRSTRARLSDDERGAALVEYVLLVALIAVICIAAIAFLGTKYHPERPYDDPRVTLSINDARNFFRTADQQYDLIVYGVLEGFDSKQVITAKLPPAHVADEWIRPGEWHPFAVRDSALRHFDNGGKRTSRH